MALAGIRQLGSHRALVENFHHGLGVSDAKGLIWLRDKVGDNFHYGAVLYCGTIPFEIDDRIWALPLSSLWRGATRRLES